MQIVYRTSMLLTMALIGARDAQAESWTTYQGNSAHTGYVPGSYDANKFALNWKKDFLNNELVTGGSPRSLPVVAGGGRVFMAVDTYYFGDEQLHAYDARTGTEIWSKSFSHAPGAMGATYSNGIVYWPVLGAGSTNTVYAYDAATGGNVFAVTDPLVGVATGAGNIADGTYYLPWGDRDALAAIDAVTGQIRWETTLTQQQNGWTPALDATNAYFYLGYGSYAGPQTGRLYAVNRTTGAIDFTIFDSASKMSTYNDWGSPVLGDQHDAFAMNQNVFNVSGNYRLIRFDLLAHSISWSLNGNFSSGMALHGGVLYVANNGNLEARDESSGTLQWTWTPPAGVALNSNVIVTDSHLFVGSRSITYAVDLATHKAVWSTNVGGQLALADNWLYIEGPDPNAYATGHLAAIGLVPEPSGLVIGLAGSCIVGLFTLIRRRKMKT